MMATLALSPQPRPSTKPAARATIKPTDKPPSTIYNLEYFIAKLGGGRIRQLICKHLLYKK